MEIELIGDRIQINDLSHGITILEKFNGDYVVSELKGFREIESIGCNCIVFTDNQTTSINLIKPIKLTEDILIKNLGFKKISRYTFVKNSFFVNKRKRGFVVGGKKGLIVNYVNELQTLYKNKSKKILKYEQC